MNNQNLMYKEPIRLDYEDKFFKNELSFINQIVDCSELTFERITFIDNTVYFHFRNLSPRPVSILTK